MVRLTRRSLLVGGLLSTGYAWARPGWPAQDDPPLACAPGAIDWAMLARLRADYRLDAVLAGATDDLDRVRRMCAWTRSRWRHNGSNEPSSGDPLTILAEAGAGRRFRCVEYAEVLAAALSACGVPARVLGLQRADVEAARSGAGHVAAEAWLADQGRWVYVDGQWDVIAQVGGRPVNAVELRDAIAASSPTLAAIGFSGKPRGGFVRWIGPYLHFFVVHNRRWTTGAPTDRKELMLVPAGAAAPKVFQRRFRQTFEATTDSPATFYAAPAACEPSERRSA